jgi:hypothetical protein
VKQRGRLVRFVQKALSNSGNVGWVLVLSLVGVLAYAATIAYFNSRTESRQRVQFTVPPSPSPSSTPSASPSATPSTTSPTFTATSSDTASFAIILTSIDSNTKKIAFDLESEGKGNAAPRQMCVSFSSFSPEMRLAGASYERMAGGTYELVDLKEVPLKSFSQMEMKSPMGKGLRGSGTFSFDTDQRHFPLDSIPLQISLYAKCSEGLQPLTASDVKTLFVENRIVDYQLTAQQWTGPDENITLRRAPFLIYLAMLLLLLAFVSALVIIAEARTKPLDLKLLTYFVGLWGIRSILLTPVQNVRAFPTLVETTIMFLFGFTVVGIGLMRFLATRKKPKKSDWSQL